VCEFSLRGEVGRLVLTIVAPNRKTDRLKLTNVGLSDALNITVGELIFKGPTDEDPQWGAQLCNLYVATLAPHASVTWANNMLIYHSKSGNGSWENSVYDFLKFAYDRKRRDRALTGEEPLQALSTISHSDRLGSKLETCCRFTFDGIDAKTEFVNQKTLASAA